MRTRRLIKTSFPLLFLLGLYFLGGRPEPPVFDPSFPAVPADADGLTGFIEAREKAHRVRPDNEARIIWSDSSRSRTEYAVVYLHGFSASQKEGDPVHLNFAGDFGCNLYLPRLADHGIDTTESMLLFTADRAWNSAKEALAIGNAIGEKVILMSTSTGGTLALMLAARYPEKVHALINMSPNIEINNPAAFLLNDPWGLQIARMVVGGKYRETGAGPPKDQYWTTRYRLEAVVQLQQLLETSMTRETFAKVTQPSLTLYYYRSEAEQDPEVRVSAMLEMHRMLSTPDSLKVEKAIPSAGAHVIGGSLASKDVATVYSEIEKFAVEKLHLDRRQIAVASKQ